MKSKIKRIPIFFTIIALMTCTIGTTVFASETTSDTSEITGDITTPDYGTNKQSPSAAKGNKNIYISYTLIYSGNGSDRWLHISPQITPNTLSIKMVDYNNNTVWEEQFTANGTTHWFVGSNVKSVYLKGVPGGVVYVSDTAN